MDISKVSEAGQGDVNYTMLLIGAMFVFLVVKELFKLVKAKKNEESGLPTWKELNDGFVRQGNCKDFKTRIGTESDEHRKNIACIKEDISEIKVGVGILKERVT